MSNWHVKPIGGYAEDSNEARDNVLAMAEYLVSRGWTVNAVAGLAGNQNNESGYNPWRWQGDDVLASNDPNVNISSGHAYGLFQFDPAGKYTLNAYAASQRGFGPKYADTAGSRLDGVAQLAFIAAGLGGYYPTSAYPETFQEFITSTKSGEYLARAWLYNYERPAHPEETEAERAASGGRWLSYLHDQPIGRSIPVWLMAELRKRRLKNVLS